MRAAHTQSQWTTFALQTVIGVALMILGAQLVIPLQPVPITMQTASMLIIGLTMMPSAATAALVSYLGLGAMGAPVFSSLSGGFGVLMGPKGGYLVGMVLAVMVMGGLRQRLRQESLASFIVISLVGSAMPFVVGLPWLALFVGWGNILALGFYPFILPGLAKAAFVTSAVSFLKK